MKKPKAKATAKAKAKSKAGAKAKTGKAAVTPEKDKKHIAVLSPEKKHSLIFNPKIDNEHTRSQYLCRPGLPYSVCGISCQQFKYDAYGGKSGAGKAANKWLKEFKATHKCK